VKTDIRLSKEKINSIDRSKQSKERSLSQLKSSVEALHSTKEGFEAELHQDLLSTLSVSDQREVDILADSIRQLTKENKETFTRRMQKEAEKNKLENTLNNNLMRCANYKYCTGHIKVGKLDRLLYYLLLFYFQTSR